MSKQTQSDGFGWDELWSAFAGQPVGIQREWMLGLHESIEDLTKRSPGLAEMLTEIMKRGSQKVKDEVFEAAPDDVKAYFGYGVVQTVETKVKIKRYISEQDSLRLLKALRA